MEIDVSSYTLKIETNIYFICTGMLEPPILFSPVNESEDTENALDLNVMTYSIASIQ